MGILSGLVKIALTPIAITKDVINIASGQEVDSTKNLIDDACKDIKDGIDDIC